MSSALATASTLRTSPAKTTNKRPYDNEESPKNPQSNAQKPRTAGGFCLEDDDDEEDNNGDVTVIDGNVSGPVTKKRRITSTTYRPVPQPVPTPSPSAIQASVHPTGPKRETTGPRKVSIAFTVEDDYNFDPEAELRAAEDMEEDLEQMQQYMNEIDETLAAPHALPLPSASTISRNKSNTGPQDEAPNKNKGKDRAVFTEDDSEQASVLDVLRSGTVGARAAPAHDIDPATPTLMDVMMRSRWETHQSNAGPLLASGPELVDLVDSRTYGISDAGTNAKEAIPLRPSDKSFYTITTCSGHSIPVYERRGAYVNRDSGSSGKNYEALIAARSKVREGRARKAYYGVDIHALVEAARKDIATEARAATRAAEKRRQEQEMEKFRADVAFDSNYEDSATRERNSHKHKPTLLWTEKYRARNFIDLLGDDNTNKLVLRWLKKWDATVFPEAWKAGTWLRRQKYQRRQQQGSLQPQQSAAAAQAADEEEQHRNLKKILLLAGPPGLGKTTLAHVCARQAGYSVLEINASDDRTKDVVNNRIRMALGTETVRTLTRGRSSNDRQAGSDGAVKPVKVRPVCVVVDEVDGVTSGTGASGEGGFVKALIDLALADRKQRGKPGGSNRKKKTESDFRQMRPLILICNDAYAPALRPLRTSGLAEIVHVGRPSADMVVQRLRAIFEREGIPCEKDAARRLCEAAWGMPSGLEARKGIHSTAEGDMRGVLVVGEWVAGRFRDTHGISPSFASPPTATALFHKQPSLQSAPSSAPILTRRWVEDHVLASLAAGGSGARGLGRGGTKDIVSRIFQDGAGFPGPTMTAELSGGVGAVDNDDGSAPHLCGPADDRATRGEKTQQQQVTFAERQHREAIGRLREMLDASGGGGGEVEQRVLADIWSEWPRRDFNDDTFLTKPNAAADWMFFDDACRTRMFSGSADWSLAPYLTAPVLAHHLLFAAPAARTMGLSAVDNVAPTFPGSHFLGPRGDATARESQRRIRAQLAALQSQLAPAIARGFRSPEAVAAELLPWLVRIVSPAVQPVVIVDNSSSAASRVAESRARSTVSVRRSGDKARVERAACVLADLGVALVHGRLVAENQDNGENTVAMATADGGLGMASTLAPHGAQSAWVFRFDPDLDDLARFDTLGPGFATAPTAAEVGREVEIGGSEGTTGSNGGGGRSDVTRYAVRQVLAQELTRTLATRASKARLGRVTGDGGDKNTKAAVESGPSDTTSAKRMNSKTTTNKHAGDEDDATRDALKHTQKDSRRPPVTVSNVVKRDFFGRIIAESVEQTLADKAAVAAEQKPTVWVTFHEGINNAVKKPISLRDFLSVL